MKTKLKLIPSDTNARTIEDEIAEALELPAAQAMTLLRVIARRLKPAANSTLEIVQPIDE
jgi:hypothetical protein